MVMNIIIILVSTILLVTYLAFQYKERRLLEIIYGKLSSLNPELRKRVIKSPSSKRLIIKEILIMLKSVTDVSNISNSLKNESHLYRKIEELMSLYARGNRTLFIYRISGNNNIGTLKNINRMLDMINIRYSKN